MASSSKYQPAVAIGIDIGTTNSCVAVLRHHTEQPEIITSSQQDTGLSIKRLIGRLHCDSHSEKYLNQKESVEENDVDKKHQLLSNATALIASLKQSTDNFLGCFINSAVITLPVYYKSAQKELIRKASEGAGITSVHLITETVAAALAYSTRSFSGSFESKTCLIYDLGGGSFHVTIFKLSLNKQFEIKASGGDNTLGGTEFADLLAKYCVHEFQKIEGVNLAGKTSKDADVQQNTAKVLFRIREECIRQICNLSTVSSVVVSLDNVHEGKPMIVAVTKETFENLIQLYLTKTLVIIEETLKKAGLEAEEIDEIILIGGSTRIPEVHNIVQEYFEGKPILSLQNKHLVACGAAIYSYNVFNKSENSPFVVALVQQDSLHKVQNFNLVNAPSLNYKGRADILYRIHTEMKVCSLNNSWSERIVILEGPAGIGKSEVARMYANMYASDPIIQNVAWIDSANIAELRNSFLSLAKSLSIDVEGKKVERIVENIYTHFSHHIGTGLLIFDNAKQMRGTHMKIFNFLPSHILSRCPLILITTRSSKWGVKNKFVITVKSFSENESVDFLCERLDVSKNDDSYEQQAKSLRIVARTLNNFSLGLTLAAPHIMTDNKITLEENVSKFITSFHAQPHTLNYKVLPFNKIILNQVCSMTVQKFLADAESSSRKLLNIIACLPLGVTTVEAVQEIFKVIFKQLPIPEDFLVLETYSLIVIQNYSIDFTGQMGQQIQISEPVQKFLRGHLSRAKADNDYHFYLTKICEYQCSSNDVMHYEISTFCYHKQLKKLQWPNDTLNYSIIFVAQLICNIDLTLAYGSAWGIAQDAHKFYMTNRDFNGRAVLKDVVDLLNLCLYYFSINYNYKDNPLFNNGKTFMADTRQLEETFFESIDPCIRGVVAAHEEPQLNLVNTLRNKICQKLLKQSGHTKNVRNHVFKLLCKTLKNAEDLNSITTLYSLLWKHGVNKNLLAELVKAVCNKHQWLYCNCYFELKKREKSIYWKHGPFLYYKILKLLLLESQESSDFRWSMYDKTCFITVFLAQSACLILAQHLSYLSLLHIDEVPLDAKIMLQFITCLAFDHNCSGNMIQTPDFKSNLTTFTKLMLKSKFIKHKPLQFWCVLTWLAVHARSSTVPKSNNLQWLTSLLLNTSAPPLLMQNVCREKIVSYASDIQIVIDELLSYIIRVDKDAEHSPSKMALTILEVWKETCGEYYKLQQDETLHGENLKSNSNLTDKEHSLLHGLALETDVDTIKQAATIGWNQGIAGISVTGSVRFGTRDPPPKHVRFKLEKPIQTFTGRETFLQELHKVVKEGQVGCEGGVTVLSRMPITVVAATGGMGKTEVVRKYVQLHEYEYDHIIWIDAEQISSAKNQFVELANRLKMAIDFDGQPKEFELIRDQIFEKLLQNAHEVLLVFDNAEAFEDDEDYNLNGIRCLLPRSLSPFFVEPTIIVTSRNQNWPLQKVIQLDLWTEAEVIIFVIERLGLRKTPENYKLAVQLGNLFGRLPTAIQSAVAVILQQIKRKKKYGIQHLIDEYGSGSRKVLAQKPLDANMRPTQTSIPLLVLYNISFEKIVRLQDGTLAIKIICIMAYMSPTRIPHDLLYALFQKDFALDSFENAIEILEDYSLITLLSPADSNSHSFSIHRMIQDATIENLRSNEERKPHSIFNETTFLNEIDVLIKLSAESMNYIKTLDTRVLSRRGEIVENLINITNHVSKRLDVKEFQDLTVAVAGVLKSTNNFTKSIQLYEAVFKAMPASEVESEIYDKIRTKLDLAHAYKDGGFIQKSVELYADVLEVQTRALGPHHEDTLGTKCAIGNALRELGKFDESAKVFSEVLQGFQNNQDTESVSFLSSKNYYALLLLEQGKSEEALQLLTNVLKEHENNPDLNSANLITTKGNIADMLAQHGKFEEAYAMMLQTISDATRVLGPFHLYTLTFKRNYAELLGALGKHEEAAQLLLELLEIEETQLGSEHPDTLITKNSLAALYLETKELDKAMALLDVEVYERVFGPEHPKTITTATNLAVVLRKQGKLGDALALQNKALLLGKQVLGPNHPQTLSSMFNIGLLHYNMEEFDKAAEVAQDLLLRQEEGLGINHPETIKTSELLTKCREVVEKRHDGSCFKIPTCLAERPATTIDSTIPEVSKETGGEYFQFKQDEKRCDDILELDSNRTNADDLIALETDADMIKQEDKEQNPLPKLIRFKVEDPTQTFTGRQMFLRDLHKMVKEGQEDLRQTPITVVAATGGIGKTETVRMYLQLYEHEYDHIIWIDAENISYARNQFVQLAMNLNISTEADGELKDFERIRDEIYERLFLNANVVLFVIDNADAFEDDHELNINGIRSLLPTNHSPFSIEPTFIVTSRNQNWPLQKVIQLDVWTETEVVLFVIENLGLEETAENKTLTIQLGNRFGYLPTFIQSAVAYILHQTKQNEKYGIQDLLEEYNSGSRQMLAQKPLKDNMRTTDLSDTLLVLWNTSMEKIVKFPDGELAIKILCYMAYMTPSGISHDFLFALFQNSCSENSFKTALQILKDFSLIASLRLDDLDSRSLTINRMIQDAIVENLRTNERQKQRLIFNENTFLSEVEVLLKLSTESIHYIDQFDTATVSSNRELVGNLVQITNHISEQLEVKEFRALSESVAGVLQNTNNLAKSIELYENVLKATPISTVKREILKNIRLKVKLAGAYSDGEHLHKSMELYLQILIDQNHELGPLHSDTLDTKCSIATEYHRLGKFNEAIVKYKEVLQEYENNQDTQSTSFLETKSNYACLLFDQGETDEALTLLKQVLKEYKTDADLYTKERIKTQLSIAAVLDMQGKFGEASELMQQTIQDATTEFGSSHPSTLTIKQNYAKLLDFQGKHEQAGLILQELLEIVEAALGPTHPSTLLTKNHLAAIFIKTREFFKAQNLLDIDALEKELGVEHPETMATASNLALLMEKQEKFFDALSLHKKILETREKVLGPNHSDTFATLYSIGSLYFKMGESENVAKVVQDLLSRHEEERRKHSPETISLLKTVTEYRQILDERNDSVRSFMTLMSVKEEIARSTLQAANWNLQDALKTFLNSNPDKDFKDLKEQDETMIPTKRQRTKTDVQNQNVDITTEAKQIPNIRVEFESVSKPSPMTTSILFRLADGKRLEGQFSVASTVKDLYEFVNKKRPNPTACDYVLTCDPNIKLTKMDDTLEQANLLNVALTQKLLDK